MIRVPTHRAPTHPGEMLMEEFLKPMGLTQRQLAEAIHVPYQRINEIVNGRRGITPNTALRLERFLGMSCGFWMDLQLRWDLYLAHEQDEKELKTIKQCASHMLLRRRQGVRQVLRCGHGSTKATSGHMGNLRTRAAISSCPK
jgi:antitoxin HigA-1